MFATADCRAALAARALALGPELNVHVDEDGTLPVEPAFVGATPWST